MKRLLMLGLLLGFLIPGISQATKLVWNPCTGADGYIVQISDDNQATWKYLYVTLGETPCELFLDNKIPFGATVHFRVKSFNGGGESNPSDTLVWDRGSYKAPAEVPMPEVNGGVPNQPNGLNVQ